MKYYVVADVHGFFDQMKIALKAKGYFTDPVPHRLIICSDLFDRGKQARELEGFILDLLSRDEVILIRGNHEDLALDLLNGWMRGSYQQYHHRSNGTIDTVLQLTGNESAALYQAPVMVGRDFLHTPYIRTIIPAMRDYFETAHYIFVHGWIPCTTAKLSSQQTEYVCMKDWRNADEKTWQNARWFNGMEAAHGGATEPGKTIVCGHWHSSFGHAYYEGMGSEFDDDADFTPYYSDGIIALDACTARSGMVNCIVLED